MKTRALMAALLLVLMSRAAAAQTQVVGGEFDRLSLQAGAGPLLQSDGYHVSAAFGFSPLSRLDLLVSVERVHVPFQRDTFSDGYSLTRGGTLTAIAGEVRVSFLPPHRVSPYALAGIGGGISRPTVNAEFATPVENDLFVVYFGGGVRIPMRGGFSLFGDARAMMALEGDDGIMGLWPVRAGLSWRF